MVDGQLFLGQTATNKIESGRIRFSESQTKFQGAYMHYDGDLNVFHLGVHEASDADVSKDINAISIKRADGNVGIGTSNPFQKLSLVDGQLFLGQTATNKVESGRIRFSEYQAKLLGAYMHYDGDKNIFHIGVHNTDDVDVAKDVNAISIVRSAGNVGIGTTKAESLLTVAGTISAQEIRVTAQAGADFVFEPNYKLRSLTELETFVNKNKHLPEIAAAADMEKNGVLQSKINQKFLQKIEELTLYTIEQEKKIKSLEQENGVLKSVLKDVELLKKEIEELKKK